jgi:hypothetical protein
MKKVAGNYGDKIIELDKNNRRSQEENKKPRLRLKTGRVLMSSSYLPVLSEILETYGFADRKKGTGNTSMGKFAKNQRANQKRSAKTISVDRTSKKGIPLPAGTASVIPVASHSSLGTGLEAQLGYLEKYPSTNYYEVGGEKHFVNSNPTPVSVPKRPFGDVKEEIIYKNPVYGDVAVTPSDAYMGSSYGSSHVSTSGSMAKNFPAPAIPPTVMAAQEGKKTYSYMIGPEHPHYAASSVGEATPMGSATKFWDDTPRNPNSPPFINPTVVVSQVSSPRSVPQVKGGSMVPIIDNMIHPEAPVGIVNRVERKGLHPSWYIPAAIGAAALINKVTEDDRR